MSLFRRVEKAVAVPGSFRGYSPENLSNLNKFLLESRNHDMLFLPGFGRVFSGKAMGCRKTGPEFGNRFSLKTATAVLSSSDNLCVSPECRNFVSVSLQLSAAGSLH